MKDTSDPLERLSVFIRNHLQYFLAHPAEMKVLSHEEGALEAPFKKQVAAIKRRYYNLARGIFEELGRQGRTNGLNPRIAVLSLYGMMNWVYKWHNPKVDPKAEELAETMARIFLHGVLIGGDRKSERFGPQRPAFERVGSAE